VRTTTIRVLEADPELGLRIPPARITQAREQLVAPVRFLDRGVWEVPPDAGEQGHLGFLILEGLLARDLVLAGSTSTELLGEGDVLQPAVAARDESLVHCHVFWHALAPVRLAVLDHRFAQSLTAFPQVTAALLERAIRRSLRMSVHQALLSLSPVETRLVVLFWHLAERWGRVTPAGIVLPLGLTHQVLGQLVGCRRASVTTALKEVIDSGTAVRRPDGSWLLTGSPPDELSHLTWHNGHSPAVPVRRRAGSAAA
jgi:CRP/FNR family cyclic AMP-dependent transcriptional regulator